MLLLCRRPLGRVPPPIDAGWFISMMAGSMRFGW
jgi:hypothetical protein